MLPVRCRAKSDDLVSEEQGGVREMKVGELGVCEASREPAPTQAMHIDRSVNSSGRTRRLGLSGWFALAVWLSFAALLRTTLQPWAFMFILAFSIYLGLKWLTWWRVERSVAHSTWRSMAYIVAWPGMNAESFLDESRHVPIPQFRNWVGAIFKTMLGVILLWFVARTLPEDHPLLRGWTGMMGLILFLHFGSFQIVALVWQSFGVDASPIMNAPLRAKSLSEFWGKRWNLGFRRLSHDLIFAPLHKNLQVAPATLLVFLASGLVHDLVISVPAHAGYGLPTGYFILQGIGVLLERSAFGRHFGLSEGVRGWLLMALITVGPVFWLFHPPFVIRVMIPFMKAIHAL